MRKYDPGMLQRNQRRIANLTDKGRNRSIKAQLGFQIGLRLDARSHQQWGRT